MSSLRQRVAAGIGANAMGQGVNVAIQLLSLPLFLSRWDVATYGTWLLLSALPAYLSMADVGMVTAAGNHMTMALGRNEVQEANKIFHSTLVFVLAVCIALAVVVFPIIALAPLNVLALADHRIALALLSGSVLMMLFSGLADAVFRSTERYASGIMLGNVIRFSEWVGSIAGLLIDGSFAAVALGAFAVRAIGLAIQVQLSRRGSHGLTWARAESSIQAVRALLRPALSFMVFPISNALSFQGLTLLVGHFFGPTTLVLFSTYRTLARVALQMTGTFSHALWPEISRLFGMGGSGAIRKLYVYSAIYSGALSISLSIALYFTSPFILEIWTHGAIEFHQPLMSLMLTYAAVGGVCHLPRVVLIATSRHIIIAYWTLGSSFALIPSSILGADLLGINGVALSMLIVEIALTSICFILTRQLIDTR